jgi:hypothetical protein
VDSVHIGWLGRQNHMLRFLAKDRHEFFQPICGGFSMDHYCRIPQNSTISDSFDVC